ncbi:hypothetical protein [Fulvivirga sp. M361]|uniref:hypothetical protein n=1 Tax=Fulvivirga sp. M361 TaxID=2594266 RepID=UPI00162375FC|nr:hypothetical protein [Fulvivirga sp. M361]
MKSKLIIALVSMAVALSFAFTIINKGERANNKNQSIDSKQERALPGFVAEDEDSF